MRRWFVIATYGVGGFALAVAMAWAGFTVAGHRLSTPADPIQPLGVSIPSTGSRSPSGATPSLRPSPAASPSEHPSSDDHSGGDGGGDD